MLLQAGKERLRSIEFWISCQADADFEGRVAVSAEGGGWLVMGMVDEW